MTATERLLQLQKLETAVREKEELLEEARLLDGGEEAEKIVRDMKKQVAEMLIVKNGIIDEIMQIEKPLYREILLEKWLHKKTLEQIAEERDYNFYYVKNSYTKSKKFFEKIINNT